MAKLIGLFPLLFFCSFLFCQDQGILLQWAPSEGASSYLLEIYQQELKVKEIPTESTSVEVPLAPGTYQYRVSVIDKLGNPSAMSSLRELLVERIQPPFLRGSPGFSIYQSDSWSAILEIHYLLDHAKVSLLIDDLEIPLEFQKTGENLYYFSLQEEALDPGNYSLYLSNSPAHEMIQGNFLRVMPTLEPVFDNISPNNGQKYTLLSDLVLTGENFIPELKIRLFLNENELPILHKQFISSTEIRFWLNLEEVEEGNYDLEGLTPWGQIIEKQNAFTVSYEEDKQDYYRRKNWGVELLLGISGISLFPSIDESSIFLGLQSSIRMDLALEAPILRDMGWIGTVEWIQDDENYQSEILSGRIGLYYRSRRNGNLNGYAALLVGSSSMYSAQKAPPNYTYPSGATLGLEAALAIQLKQILLEPGFNTQIWLTQKESISYIGPYFRAGYRF